MHAVWSCQALPRDTSALAMPTCMPSIEGITCSGPSAAACTLCTCVATRFYASSPGYSPRGSRQRHKSRTHYCVPGRRESACCARTGPATRHSPVGDRSWSLTAISSPTSPALEFNCRLRPPRASTVLRIAPNWTLLPKTVTRSTRSRACGSHSV